MQTVTSKNLRLNLGEILQAVAAGNEYEITFQKKVVGKIVPINSNNKSGKELVEFLNSEKFANYSINNPIPKNLKEYSNFKDFHKWNYTKYDN